MNRNRVEQGCEWGVFALLIVILAGGPLATGAVRSEDFLIIQWLVFGMALLWAIRIWASRSPTVFCPPAAWVLLGFLLYATGRSWTAELPYIAHQEWMRILTYTILFFVVIQNLRDPRMASWIGLAMVALAMMISWYAIYQFCTGSDRVWHFVRPPQYGGRGSGTYICPNHLAGFLELIQPVALAFTLSGRFGPITKIFLGYSFLVITAGILVTVSRGGYLASLVSVGCLLTWLIRERLRRPWLWLGLGLALLAGAVAFLRPEFSTGRSTLERLTNNEDVRILVWKPAWRMWQDHFWFGVGPDHFDHRFRQYRPADWDIQSRPDRVHNDYLNVLVDWGLMGSLFPLSFGFLFLRNLVRSRKNLKRLQEEPAYWQHNLTSFVAGSGAGLLAILVHSFFDYNWHIPANAIIAIVWMALIMGIMNLANSERGTRWRLDRSAPWGWVAVGAAVLMGCQSVMKTWELALWAFADRAAAFSDEKIKALERVAAWVPSNFEIPYQIGEVYRLRSWQGFEGYEDLARRAMPWFEKAWQINPYDPYNYVKYGMCLDWINEKDKAESYFLEAHKKDPNGYFITALVGWHYMTVTNYLEAKRWFERSTKLYGDHNVISAFYLNHVNQKLRERDSGLKPP